MKGPRYNTFLCDSLAGNKNMWLFAAPLFAPCLLLDLLGGSLKSVKAVANKVHRIEFEDLTVTLRRPLSLSSRPLHARS